MIKFLLGTTAIATMLAASSTMAGGNMPAGARSDTQLSSAAVRVVKIDYLFSANELIGETVRNGKGEDLGSVEDLIVTGKDKVVMAILSVGGFLGVGDKLIAVSYDELKPGPDGFVLYDVTPEDLERLAGFTYEDEETRARERYMRSLDRRIDRWTNRIDGYYVEGKAEMKEGAKEARKKLQEMIDDAKAKLNELENASGDAWEDGKQAVEETMNDISRAWNDATS